MVFTLALIYSYACLYFSLLALLDIRIRIRVKVNLYLSEMGGRWGKYSRE